MQTSDADQVRAAEARLDEARQRLHALRRAALTGEYDPRVFHQAVASYLAAERAVLVARGAGEAVRSADTQAADEAAAALDWSSAAEPPTKQMRFVRWLVETGRLTEWPAAGR